MIQIQRKDLPLKGFITTFESKLNEPEMNKQIKKVIDKYGDRQNHKTNVKAQSRTTTKNRKQTRKLKKNKTIQISGSYVDPSSDVFGFGGLAAILKKCHLQVAYVVNGCRK